MASDNNSAKIRWHMNRETRYPFSERPPDKRSAFPEAVKTEQGLYWRYRAPPAPKVAAVVL